MGWKAIKEQYQIKHNVHVAEEGICIGSDCLPKIMIIDREGCLVSRDTWSRGDLKRYEVEMDADPALLKRLAATADSFSNAITVYTYNGATIIEKQCETLGWPNVTHDGCLMHENMFSTDRNEVLRWAKRSAARSVKFREQLLKDAEQALFDARSRLAQAEADVASLSEEASAERSNES